MGEFVRLEVADGVGVVRVDRPPANALDQQIGLELQDAFRAAAERDDVGALVIWGGPRIFAAGADIKAMAEFDPEQVRPFVAALGDALDMLEAMPKVSIAAINGYAFGGGFELALAADLRYLAADGKVGQPEIRLGVIPGAGGTQRLTHLVGPGRARDLVYTGRQVAADEAHRLGLVERVMPPGDVLATATEDAIAFARGPRLALAAAKAAIRAAVLTPGPKGSAGRSSCSGDSSGPLTSAKACGRSWRSASLGSTVPDTPGPILRLAGCCEPVPSPVFPASGMNRPRRPFEEGDIGVEAPHRTVATKGSERRVRGQVPGRFRPDAPEAQQELRRRPRLRRPRLRDEALRLQQVGLLLAARTGPLVRPPRETQAPGRGVGRPANPERRLHTIDEALR